MRIFRCPACAGVVFNPDTGCGVCGTALVWDPASRRFAADAAPCGNREAIGCNWRAEEEGGLCLACAMTIVVPDDFPTGNVALWRGAEAAKRGVLATLDRWGWFGASDPGPLPRFRMLSERTRDGVEPVLTAHDRGEVTLNVVEADLVEREGRGAAIGDRLRTMAGHIRHELAHALFERLRDRPGFLDAFRETMGDEREDYPTALAAWHEAGPPSDWAGAHVSPYAAAHPHEDWAETATHLLHLTDVVDSAAAAGLRIEGLDGADYDAYAETDTDRLLDLGVRLATAVNHVNRSVGRSDLYPFVVTPGIRAKMAFVHAAIRVGPAG